MSSAPAVSSRPAVLPPPDAEPQPAGARTGGALPSGASATSAASAASATSRPAAAAEGPSTRVEAYCAPAGPPGPGGAGARSADVAAPPAGPGFSAALLAATAGACVNGPTDASGAPPQDLSCMVGSREYYRARHDDFVRRNPGLPVPDYYLAYGEKYAHAFTRETFQKLSPEGQAWLMRTFTLLQEALEQKRQADPEGFARLERDPEALRRFAYDTHSRAYLEAGLKELPPRDLLHIANTPQWKDLLTLPGLAQIGETLVGLAGQHAEGLLTPGR